MAELTAAETTADRCCAPEQQADCCEPSEKADCCGHEKGCGCAAGSTSTQASDVREQVREHYAAAVHVTTTDLRAFALDGLTRRLKVIGVPLDTL